jgi:microcystin-dependent protein
MAFVTNTWTNQGISLLTQIVAGSGYFNITRVEAGQGYPTGSDNPATFVGLKSYVMDAQITSLNVEAPYQATIRIRVASQYAPQTFNWNEFGIFGNSGSGPNIMLAYGTTGANTGDTVTPGGSAANVNRDCAVILPFSNQLSVTTTATLNPAPELHAVTHRSTGADPLAIAQSATSGVAPPTPNNASMVLLGGTTAAWGAVPHHAPTHLDNGTDPIPVTTTAHDGLCPRLNGDPTSTLRGDGTWNTGFVPGLVLDFAGYTPPNGWLICDGQFYATASYPSLFAVLGYNYGGSGASFAVPDCRGRAVIGAGQAPGLSNRPIASKGGEETHQISLAEMYPHIHGINDPGHAHSVYDPSHNHSVYDPSHAHGVYDPTHGHSTYDPAHFHAYINPVGEGLWVSLLAPEYGNQIYGPAGGTNTSSNPSGVGVYGARTGISIYAAGTGISNYGNYTGIGIYGAGTGISTQYSGSGTPHNTMMPFIAMNKIIKT